MNYYYQKVLELNADGIDFISLSDLFDNNKKIKPVVKTITRQNFENNEVISIPKTGYRFWRMINGEKVYIDDE